MKNKKLAIALLGLVTLATAGCVATGTATVATSASVELVMVSPGIYVVEDHPRAVFYSDNFYWRYDTGVWYRSRYYNNGFVRVGVRIVPQRVRRIDRPRRYRNYRGRKAAKRRAIHRDRRDARKNRRDTRKDRRKDRKKRRDY